MGSPGVPGVAEASLGAEEVVHNRALGPPQNLDLPIISHTGICCETGKSAAFQSALPAPPALLLGPCIFFSC